METTSKTVLFINGERLELPQEAPLPLVELLRRYRVDPETGGTAVAVNEAVISKAEWPAVQLSDGDRVEIVQARQRG